jgi:hypothetical protein
MIDLMVKRSDCCVYSLGYDDRKDLAEMADQLASFHATLIADGVGMYTIAATIPFRGELLVLVTP